MAKDRHHKQRSTKAFAREAVKGFKTKLDFYKFHQMFTL